ncbi:efflux RND transporter periplasmic adaptor subunit [Glaciecola sp. 1036]|uniref:efflux RND transporter periplasmic adaptor subunit n=1 Tax=Alteromonadaceae TaxID=72275 RepID=UPI003CFC894D
MRNYFVYFLLVAGLYSLSTEELRAQNDQPIYICPMHNHITSDTPGDCPICGMDLVAKKTSNEHTDDEMLEMHGEDDHESMDTMQSMPSMQLDNLFESTASQYVCPMHEHIVKDHPGTCPICGMDLVPKKSAQTSKGPSVQVSGAMQQSLAIQTALVQRGSIQPVILAYGSVEYDETKIRHIHSRVSGWIEKLAVNSLGEAIKKGDLLYEIYSPELIVAQDDFLSLLASGISNPELIERGKKRLSLLGVDDALIERIANTKKSIYQLPYYARQSGVVDRLDVREGMYVQPAQEMMMIADRSEVWIVADVSESNAPLIEQNLKVNLSVPAADINDLSAPISFIYPDMDPNTRTMKLRVDVPNQKQTLKPGMLAKLEIQTQALNDVLYIPLQALIRTGKSSRVIVQTNDQEFVQRKVAIGVITDDLVEIRQGLSIDERVVTSGQFLLDSEASLSHFSNGLSEHDEKTVMPQSHNH